jgi:hypothetical protein
VRDPLPVNSGGAFHLGSLGATLMEAMMSRVITFDKGSKRRMKQIRWKLREVISAVALSLIVLGLGVLLAFWEVSHYSAEPKTPHVEAKP